MIFDVITIFPGFFSSILEHGLLKRALRGGNVQIHLHDLRDYADDRHHTVDDRPFGGGPGMIFKPEPLFRAVEALKKGSAEASFPIVLLSPQGRLLKQAVTEELAQEARVVLICGRYEGVDERIAESLATDELSIGDYVLSGGELAAAVVMEAVTRLLPGVLGNEASPVSESFEGGLLEYPQYTRPPEFRGKRVPDVLLSGDHVRIARWRRWHQLTQTHARRPEMFRALVLDAGDRALLELTEDQL